MASQLLTNSSQVLATLADYFKEHRATSLTAIGAAVVLPLAIRDYLIFLSYGPGGVPYNIGGWLVVRIMGLITREQHSTTPYDNSKLPLADQPGLLPADFPPKRGSPRPRIGPHAVPQRQLDQLPSKEIRQKLIDGFSELAKTAQAKGLVEVKQSLYERRHEGIFVSKSRQWHAVAQQTRGEVSHIHAGLDGSIHVVLHPEDCKAVMNAGWSQRHSLSGVDLLQKLLGFSIPINYVLIYAPRNDAEVEIALTIAKASIGYMTGTRGELE